MNMRDEEAGLKKRGKIHFERTYKATLDEVWELWTTREGFESWWGPEGFTTKVLKLELKPGGALRYAMTATGKDQIEFMKQAGMALTTESKGRIAEVVPKRRLVFFQTMDFVPGVAPYEMGVWLELQPSGDTVKMRLTLDAAHDEQWTKNATMGWESQLGKLAKVLERVGYRAGDVP